MDYLFILKIVVNLNERVHFAGDKQFVNIATKHTAAPWFILLLLSLETKIVAFMYSLTIFKLFSQNSNQISGIQ